MPTDPASVPVPGATNAAVVRLLAEMASLTELAEGSPQAFRVRAYQNAGRAVEGLTTDVATMSASALTKVKGIGASTDGDTIELLFDGTQPSNRVVCNGPGTTVADALLPKNCRK